MLLIEIYVDNYNAIEQDMFGMLKARPLHGSEMPKNFYWCGRDKAIRRLDLIALACMNGLALFVACLMVVTALARQINIGAALAFRDV